MITGGNCYGIWAVGEEQIGNIVNNNIIQSNITYGLSIQDGKEWVISGNQFVRNSGGINIEAGRNISICNNSFIENLAMGIMIGEKTDTVIINGNSFQGNNYIDPDVAGYGGDIVIWGENRSIMLQENSMEENVKVIEN